VRYINDQHLREMGINWPSLLATIEEATRIIEKKDISQPLKPYLRFNDPANRIIAMPAYIGGTFNMAGIKWIASFPGNVSRSLKRAHSVVVLNDASTGVPVTLINSATLSGIRTAAVSGFVLGRYLTDNRREGLTAGIIGLGPIGQLHLSMLDACFGEMPDSILLYDSNPDVRDAFDGSTIGTDLHMCSGWDEVYEGSDILITCTVARERYINKQPKRGGVYLNVSLRDFSVDLLEKIDLHIVDNWDEVCRENTDIECAHLKFGLEKDDVLEIQDILTPNSLANLADRSFMFNPMGMAVYDIAVAKYYQNLAESLNCQVLLQD